MWHFCFLFQIQLKADKGKFIPKQFNSKFGQQTRIAEDSDRIYNEPGLGLVLVYGCLYNFLEEKEPLVLELILFQYFKYSLLSWIQFLVYWYIYTLLSLCVLKRKEFREFSWKLTGGLNHHIPYSYTMLHNMEFCLFMGH